MIRLIVPIMLVIAPMPAVSQEVEDPRCPTVVDADGHTRDLGTDEYEVACQHIKDLAAIRAHGQRWNALYEAGDFEAMRTLYTPDAVLMTNGAPKQDGVDAILKFLSRGFQAGHAVTFEFVEENLAIDGDRADLIARFWMKITMPDGRTHHIAGRSWLTFRRGENGDWLIWRDMDNQAPDVRIEDRP